MESRITPLLATARIANVPSVISNLAVGILIGSIDGGSAFRWPWFLTIAAILLYVGGNFLNDYADRDWDNLHRPERALPKGVFPPFFYLLVALACFVVGLLICGTHGWMSVLVGAGIVMLIIVYTKFHKQSPLAVIPMGMCRAGLPLLGYVAMRNGISASVLFPSVSLLIYIISLSISARSESQENIPLAKRYQGKAMLDGAGVLSSILPILIIPAVGWIGLIPFIIWIGISTTRFRSPVSAHVSALLAGIPLLDWVTLLPMAIIWVQLKRVGIGDPMFLIALTLPPIAFIFGRKLQRIAPAT